MKINLSKIKASSWYRQQTACKLYFVLGPGMGAVKQLNGGQDVIFYFKQNDFRGYYSENYFLKLALEQFLKIKNDPKYLSGTHKTWTKGNGELLKLIHGVRRLKLKKLADNNLLALNKQIGWLAQTFWDRPIFMDIFDVNAHELITNELRAMDIDIRADDLAILLSAPKISFAQKYQLALRQLPKLPHPRDIKKIINEFYFIKCSYSQGLSLTIADVKKDLRHKYSEPLPVAKSRLYAKYGLTGWPKRMLESFAFLAQWREQRKMMLQKTVFALNVLGQEIALRSHLSWEDVALCLPYKIDSIPVNKKLIQKYKTLCQHNFLAIYNKNSKQTEFLDKQSCKKILTLLETKNHQQTLKGQVACSGKVTGIARLISGEADFDKFRPGDILITSMTRPEFMPLLRRAKGIITDEGGITCHAAIVSRELDIPCIIGTRNATRVIHNGDRIRLDATQGKITIINQ